MRLDGTSSRTGGSRTGGERGLSAVVGVVLLVVIVVLGSVVTVIVGTAALGDTRKSVEVTRAEGAMAEFDARVADTAFGPDGASNRSVEFGDVGPDGYLETTRDSWIRVDIVGGEIGLTPQNVVDAKLGTVAYRHGETTVAYEGGGVWRSDGEATTMVSPPEFHYRNRTLTLPIVNISGGSDEELSTAINVRKSGPPDRRFPDSTRIGFNNRVEQSQVIVTVHSDYYRAWGEYFERTTGSYVGYNDAAQTVTVIFLSVPTTGSFSDGIIATSGTGEFALAGNGAYTDSYNSAVGPYNVSKGDNGDVYAAGNVTMVGDSEVEGDIYSGKVVNLTGSAIVHKNVNWTTEYIQTGSATVYGTVEQHDGVLTVLPIDGFVTDTVDDIQSKNDNDNTSLITNDRIDFGGSDSGTLGSGTYYFEDLSLFGEDLVLDTTTGNITIAVRDYVRVDRGGKGNKGATISVKGNNTVQVYVASEGEVTVTTTENNALDRDRDLNLYVSPDALVEVPQDRSTQLQIFATSDFSMAIAANQGKPAAFYGLVYAPAGYFGTGEVYIKQAEVAGAIVTGSMILGQNGAVHYDEAVKNLNLPQSPTAARLEYMHVAVHEVDVTNR